MSPEVEVEVEPAGLRARKKQRTRETIIRVAMELFAERGFEATTIADIAEAADIAPRTFFGYFPTKEDVVFHDTDANLESFTARMRDRDPDETTFDALRAWLVAFVEQTDFDDPAERARKELVRATPALEAHHGAHRALMETVIGNEVAKDLDVPPTSLRPHLVAAAATAALDTLGSYYDDLDPQGDDRVLAILDEALVFLHGGLDALRRRPVVS